MLETRQCRLAGNGLRIPIDNGLGEHIRRPQGAQRDRAEAAVLEGADVGGRVRIVLAAAVRPRAFALGVDDVPVAPSGENATADGFQPTGM